MNPIKTNSPFTQKEVKGLISVCIVTRNASESLKSYLDSVMKSVGDTAKVEIIVIDNESTDDTKSMLQEGYPNAQHIYCEPGVGFTKGVNLAVTRSQGEFILIATPSTEAIGNSIPLLLDHLNQYPNVGVVGPKIINPDGTTQHSSKKMPTPTVAMLHTFHLFGLIGPNRILNEYFLYDYTSDQPIEAESLTMSLLIARRRVFENVGLLDEDLFIWASDVDWCHKVQQTTWKQFFIPKAVAIHRRNSVSKKQPYRNLVLYHKDLRYFYRKHFFKDHNSVVNFLWVLVLQIRFIIQTMRYLIKGGKDYSFY